MADTATASAAMKTTYPTAKRRPKKKRRVKPAARPTKKRLRVRL